MLLELDVNPLPGDAVKPAAVEVFAALAELGSFTAAFAFLGAASIASGFVVAFLVRETLGMGVRPDRRSQPGREGRDR